MNEPYKPCDSFRTCEVRAIDCAGETHSAEFNASREAQTHYERLAKQVPAVYRSVALYSRTGKEIRKTG